VFRRRQKEVLVKDANIMALGGLAAVGSGLSAAVLLVVSYVDQGLPAVIITVFVVSVRRRVVRTAAGPPPVRFRSEVPAVNCGKPG
jgi:hypothetical protein